MNWTVSIIICAVALAVWIAATVGERKLRKKREAALDEKVKRPEVFHGRDYNSDRYRRY